MARLIQKSGYIKNGKVSGYMEYVATRDGVEIIQSTEPVTRKQERFIKRLLKDFPDAKELFEYSDYMQTPNRGTASAFIATVLDTHLHEVESESGYMSYIAQRPRAEKHGGHGLFSEADVTDLKAAKAELEALSAVCHAYHMPLFVDGARLGYALASKGTDVTLADVARLTDVFYIGGTKVGALFGEAVVIMNENLKKDFRFIMKQRGGRMAKGRLLGVQFDTLFTDDLYFKISRHAIEMAHQIRDIFVSAGYPLLFDSPTNQQYPIMSDDELAILGKSFGYEYWERVDETHSGVRFCASWATKQEHVDALRAAVNALKK